jgi:hypothetical protein
MNRHIHFYSEKSGFGVTATALMFAYKRSNGLDVLFATQDADDAIALAGLSPNDWDSNPVVTMGDLHITEYAPGIKASDDYSYFITESDSPIDDENVTNIAVVENHYLSLRRFVSKYMGKVDLAVCVFDADSALNARDVSAVLGTKNLSIVPRNSDIARAFDAGIIERAVGYAKIISVMNEVMEVVRAGEEK